MNLLNPVDIVLGIFFTVMAVKGAFKGLISEAFGLFGLALGILLADTFNEKLGALMVKYMSASQTLGNILSFFVIFFVVYTTIFIAGVVITAALKKVDLGFINRTFGFFFGLAKALIVVVVLALILNSVSFLRPISKNMQKSSYIYAFTNKAIQQTNLMHRINEAITKGRYK